MSNILKKPYLLFLPFCLIAFVISKFWFGGVTINVHDTYFVVSHHDLALLISILFGIIGLIYWFVEKVSGSLSKRLNFIHVALTFGGIFLILILNEFFKKSIMEYDFNENLRLVIYFISAIAILGQVIFPINIIITTLRNSNKAKSS